MESLYSSFFSVLQLRNMSNDQIAHVSVRCKSSATVKLDFASSGIEKASR